ncbi:MAG: ABC transporter substrate-binding protein [Deltaproteobacteria bacterium]|nr:ABC transporter substrate-binding protein [Deltaproteobacteria bacterium]
MKFFRLFIVSCFILLFFCVTVQARPPKPRVMVKIATLAPRGSEIMKNMEAMDREIRKKTGNEVGFKVFYGGVQGDENDVLRKMRMGQLNGGAFTGHGLGQLVPQVRVMELPYLFWNYDEVDYVRSHLYKEMEKLFDKKGYVVIGWDEVGFIYNFSKIPITSIKIARSQKWWMWEGDALSRAMFHEFGITPVELSFTDVMTSLSTRLVDSASITPYGAVAFRWYTRFNYISEYPTTNVVAATIVSKRIWKKISPKSQDIILKVAPAYFKQLSSLARRQNYESVAVLKKSGIKVVPFDEKSNELSFVFKAAKNAREKLVGELYSQKLLDQTLALLAEYRKAHPESHVIKIE